MNIISRVIWGVELNDPVYSGNVETTGCDVCAEKDTGFGVAELEERVCTLLLLLFTLSEREFSAKPYSRLDSQYAHEGRERGHRCSSGVRRDT